MYSANRSGGVCTHGCSTSGAPWNCRIAIFPLTAWAVARFRLSSVQAGRASPADGSSSGGLRVVEREHDELVGYRLEAGSGMEGRQGQHHRGYADSDPPVQGLLTGDPLSNPDGRGDVQPEYHVEEHIMPRPPCAAVRTLDSVLRGTFPLLAGSFKDVKGVSQRLQTGGNPRHQMGVCLDILLFSREWKLDPSVDWKREKLLAENLVRAFVDLKDDMKWTEIILQNRLFWEPEYYKHYTQDQAHYTHIHIDWMTNSLKGKGKSEADIIALSPQAKNDGFRSTLTARLQGIKNQFDGDSLPVIDLAAIAKPLNPDLNPVGDWRVAVGQWIWIYSFDASGNVTWRDPLNGLNGKGTWKNAPGLINFQWANSTTTENWKTPIKPSEQKGTTTMKGTTYEVNAVRL
jgi:hypothetical protein